MSTSSHGSGGLAEPEREGRDVTVTSIEGSIEGSVEAACLRRLRSKSMVDWMLEAYWTQPQNDLCFYAPAFASKASWTRVSTYSASRPQLEVVIHGMMRGGNAFRCPHIQLLATRCCVSRAIPMQSNMSQPITEDLR